METTPLAEDIRNDKSYGNIKTVTVGCEKLRQYWVRFQNEKIEIGRQGESSPLLSFVDRPHEKEGEDHREVVRREFAYGSAKCQTESAIWKTISDGSIPENAFFAGNDKSCDLLVGRAYHEDDLLPGKVCLKNNTCYVTFRGKAYEKKEFEVLTGNNYKWVSYTSKAILVDAVPIGNTADGSTLYIGRTFFNNALAFGKVYPVTGLAYIPYSGLERTFTQYDILVFKSKHPSASSTKCEGQNANRTSCGC